MGYKKDIRSIYNALNDPFYKVNWIYNHFNQNVPYISSPPHLKEYDMPENIDKLIEEERKRIDRTIGRIEFLLYLVGFFLVFNYFSSTPKHGKSVWSAILATLGSYGWMALITYELFFSRFVSNIGKRKKNNTTLYKR